MHRIVEVLLFERCESLISASLSRALSCPVLQVNPGFIRIEADELTYPLHIVLRFGLEKGLFDGSVSTAEVPAEWNKQAKALLGLEVQSDSQGCLQDVHWSFGASTL